MQMDNFTDIIILHKNTFLAILVGGTQQRDQQFLTFYFFCIPFDVFYVLYMLTWLTCQVSCRAIVLT